MATVRLPGYLKRLEALRDELQRQHDAPDVPSLLMKSFCDVCEFLQHCTTDAVAKGHMEMLRGMSAREILSYNHKGIFTLDQLSYTFRFRRPRKRAKDRRVSRNYALQALSLREGRIHVHGSPIIPTANTRLFIDVEGVPATGHYYLIGVLAADKDTSTYQSFWADRAEDQVAMATAFLAHIEQYSGSPIFHYGSYDATAIRKLGDCAGGEVQKRLTRIVKRLTDLLLIVHNHLYFPSYSNGLKHLGHFFGCK